MNRLNRGLLFAIPIVAYSILMWFHFATPSYPEHADTVWHVALAKKHALTDPMLFSNGQWPGGYPALLRIGTVHLRLHPVLIGRALSWLAGLVILLSVMLVCFRIGSSTAAALSAIALLGNETFLRMAGMEGTDAPAAALQILSVALLAGALGSGQLTKKTAALSGLVLGAAYLFRYTALIFVPIAVVFLMWNPRRGWARMCLFLVAFILVAIPQLYSSALVTGNPLYNQMARNVWLGMYVGTPSPSTWPLAPPDVGLWELVASDPLPFFRNWSSEVFKFFIPGTLWSAPMQILALFAAGYLLFCGSIDRRTRFLLFGATFIPVISVGMAFFVPRHGLVPIIGWSMIIGLAGSRFANMHRLRLISETRWKYVLGLIAGGCVALLIVDAAHSFRTNPNIRFAADIDRMAGNLGIERRETVATNMDMLVNIESGWLERYCPIRGVFEAHSVDELLAHEGPDDDWQFVILNYDEFWGDFSDIRKEAAAGGSRLVPIHLGDSLGVYMIRPEGIGQVPPDSILFASGPMLLGHSWVWRHDAVLVYLYWTARDTLSERFETEARLVDETGVSIAMSSGEPELGTYPTTRWMPTEVIVDLHILQPLEDEFDQGVLEVCIHSKDGVSLEDRECHSLEGLYKGGRTPLP